MLIKERTYPKLHRSIRLGSPNRDPLDSPQVSWSCRMIDFSEPLQIGMDDAGAPRVGDVAVVEIQKVSNHTRIVNAANERRRFYPRDRFIGVFGNRYATDAFEAEVSGVDRLDLLTNAGMLGTVQSRHCNTAAPTRLKFLGFLTSVSGRRLNLKEAFFNVRQPATTTRNVVLVVGTGMNSGKTTTAARLVKGLVSQGIRVAACKLTGSVSHRDVFELRSASPAIACDFSDYGFPSTYLCSQSEISDLFHTMLADVRQVNPEIVVMEIADGVLQRETSELLRNELISKSIAGVLLTAPCALSALQAVSQVQMTGHRVVGVSGIICNSPLFTREFGSHCDLPVCSSLGNCDQLVANVMHRVQSEA